MPLQLTFAKNSPVGKGHGGGLGERLPQAWGVLSESQLFGASAEGGLAPLAEVPHHILDVRRKSLVRH